MEPAQLGDDLLHAEAGARSERRAEVSPQTPGPGPTQGPDDEPPVTTLRGRPLLLARAAWVILAAAVLLLDAAGIPYAYARAKEICTDPAACVGSGRLTAGGARTLQQLGISPEFFAAYVGVVALPLGFGIPIRAVVGQDRRDAS